MKETDLRAQDLMTPDPVTVTPEASITEVWDLMRERGVRHLPVVEGEALVGMLSDRDLARFDVGRLLTDGGQTLRRELETPAVNVMTADVVTVAPEAELAEVIDVLVDNRIGAVAVVRPETQELVGIVSYIDVLKAVRDWLDMR